MNIQLRHFIAFPRPRVGHIHPDGGIAAGSNRFRLDPQVIEMKRRIAESKSEGE